MQEGRSCIKVSCVSEVGALPQGLSATTRDLKDEDNKDDVNDLVIVVEVGGGGG